MFVPRFYLFLAALCSCSVLGLGDVVKPQAPELLDITSVPKTVTDEILESPTSTEPVTTDETTPPSTTITTPKTTSTTSTTPKTTSTTSTTPKTTSTTSTTTTTTTTPPPPPPTPAPKPKPVPAPEQGIWNYTDASNVTCIVAQFAAQITVTYTKSVLNKTSLANITMNVPSNASVLGGSCNDSATEQWMAIGWLADNGAPVAIRLQFYKNDTTRNYGLHCFNLTIDGSILVNTSLPADSVVMSHGEEWVTPLATSYRCASPAALSMSNDTYSVSSTVAITKLQDEAFRTAHGMGFSAARDCGGDVPDAVPIAVGCALGGLVLVVLAAYLFARRRYSARGYLSM